MVHVKRPVPDSSGAQYKNLRSSDNIWDAGGGLAGGIRIRHSIQTCLPIFLGLAGGLLFAFGNEYNHKWAFEAEGDGCGTIAGPLFPVDPPPKVDRDHRFCRHNDRNGGRGGPST